MNRGVEAKLQDIGMSKAKQEDFLFQGRILRIATKGNVLHLVPIWYVFENGRIYISTNTDSKKVKDIRKNNKVAMCVDVGEYYYDLKNVKMSGVARILENGDLAKRMAEKIMVKYLGSSTHPQATEYLSGRIPHVTIEIEITKIFSEDYSLLSPWANNREGGWKIG
jgi:nitroimidazol reductase NimA-like FMN-containing flavoprotein (pyridoxamine 5'-phosphate oxidase superfamily)